MSDTECPECDETVPIADLCCGKCVVKAIRAELRKLQTSTTGVGAIIGTIPYAEDPSTLQGQLRAANKHCEIAVDGRDKARKREDRYRMTLVNVRANLAAPHQHSKGVACMECALVEMIDEALT